MRKEPQQKIREISTPIDQDFQTIRSEYSLAKGDTIQLIKQGNMNINSYQKAIIDTLEILLTDKFISDMKRNWNNDIAISVYSIEAFESRRIKQIMDANPDLEPQYELEVTAKYVNDIDAYSKFTPLNSYLGQSRTLATLQQNIEFMPTQLRKVGKDIEIINTINKISFYNTKTKKISLDTPVIVEYVRLKNDNRYLIKNILYIMKEKKETTAYDRASGRTIVRENDFYSSIDQIIGLMSDVHNIEYKPEKNPEIIPLSRKKNLKNIEDINKQGEEAAIQLKVLRTLYDKKRQRIPKEIYDELKLKVLARTVIKGQTNSRMEWDVMTHLWHKWDQEAIPHTGYKLFRSQELDQFKDRRYLDINLPEDKIFKYILDKLKPITGTDNIIRY